MMKCIVDKLRKQHRLSSDEYRVLLTMRNPQDVDYLMTQAREVAQQQFLPEGTCRVDQRLPQRLPVLRHPPQ